MRDKPGTAAWCFGWYDGIRIEGVQPLGSQAAEGSRSITQLAQDVKPGGSQGPLLFSTVPDDSAPVSWGLC